LAKETRLGLLAVDLDVLVTAKIRPFEDKHCVDYSLTRGSAHTPSGRNQGGVLVVVVVDGQDMADPPGVSPGQTVFRGRAFARDEVAYHQKARLSRRLLLASRPGEERSILSTEPSSRRTWSPKDATRYMADVDD
jgi:hypothetical protein